MRRTFTLPIKPFSINTAYYRDRAYKTAECRDWEHSFLNCLGAPDAQKAMRDLRTQFDPDKHSYQVRLVHTYPVDKYFAKNGRISTKGSFDLSNTEKLICDLLFDDKHCSEMYGKNFTNLASNDCFITALYSYKKPGPTHSIQITIKIVPKLVAHP